MININGKLYEVLSLVWQTSMLGIGEIRLLLNDAKDISLKEDDTLTVTWGVPGNMEKISGYKVKRIRKNDDMAEVVAFEFGGTWLAKRQEVHAGPRQAVINKLISRNGEKAGGIDIAGGEKTYTQYESDIAFLYRMAGNLPVWRDAEGSINISQPPAVKIEQIIDYKWGIAAGKKYIATGITPTGEVFQITAGEGIEINVAETFHSTVEAKEYIQRLAETETRGKLICIGLPGIRAGCEIILPGEKKHRVTKCVHEVGQEAWTVTAYLN